MPHYHSCRLKTKNSDARRTNSQSRANSAVECFSHTSISKQLQVQGKHVDRWSVWISSSRQYKWVIPSHPLLRSELHIDRRLAVILAVFTGCHSSSFTCYVWRGRPGGWTFPVWYSQTSMRSRRLEAPVFHVNAVRCGWARSDDIGCYIFIYTSCPEKRCHFIFACNSAKC